MIPDSTEPIDAADLGSVSVGDDASAGSPQVEVLRFDGETLRPLSDLVAREEPLQIDVVWYRHGRTIRRPVSVTMRTPPQSQSDPQDRDLAIGFLLTERVIRDLTDVVSVDVSENIASVHFRPGVVIELCDLRRRTYTTSACGVCGKTTIDQVMLDVEPLGMDDRTLFLAKRIAELPTQLRFQQPLFRLTGGLHGCGLIRADDDWCGVAEDVGRHNALDKLIGSISRLDPAVFAESAVVLSGRVSFELIQKSAVAGIPVIVAVGAPSSLAIETADRFNQTLIGFVRGQCYNVYTHPHRVRL